MIIESSKHAKNNYIDPVVPAAQLVNRIGKYLYKHIDSAYKFDKSSNMCDVYITVLYSMPDAIVKQYKLTNPEYTRTNELSIDINITTYQNKLRMNLIEVDPNERTLSFDTFPPEKLQNMQDAYDLIYNKIINRLKKEFKGFDFIF